MGTAVNGTDTLPLEIIGVHLLPSLAVLMPDACGVATPHASGMGRSALFMVRGDRRATRAIDAPLAGRRAIAQITWELEDMDFKYLKPAACGCAR